MNKTELLQTVTELQIGLGELDINDLRKQAIRNSGFKADFEYEHLTPANKTTIDHQVEEMQKLSSVVNTLLANKAKLVKMQYKCFRQEGFTEDQAFQLTLKDG